MHSEGLTKSINSLAITAVLWKHLKKSRCNMNEREDSTPIRSIYNKISWSGESYCKWIWLTKAWHMPLTLVTAFCFISVHSFGGSAASKIFNLSNTRKLYRRSRMCERYTWDTHHYLMASFFPETIATDKSSIVCSVLTYDKFLSKVSFHQVNNTQSWAAKLLMTCENTIQVAPIRTSTVLNCFFF